MSYGDGKRLQTFTGQKRYCIISDMFAAPTQFLPVLQPWLLSSRLIILVFYFTLFFCAYGLVLLAFGFDGTKETNAVL